MFAHITDVGPAVAFVRGEHVNFCGGISKEKPEENEAYQQQ
jgi:hypothetical protein